MSITRRGVLRGLGGLAGGGAAAAGYAFGVEPALRLRIQHYALTPPGWTPGLKLKIAALADIHAGGPVMRRERLENIVETTNALGADLIVLLGDYNGADWFTHKEFLPWDDVAGLLAQLKAPLGAFAIQGNHEYWDDPGYRGGVTKPTAMQRALDKRGVPLLDNAARRIVADGGAFWLVGLASQIAVIGPRHGKPRGLYGLDDLPRALDQASDDAPAILLAHEPDIFARGADRVCLQLSGHTHGGQVRLFGWSPAVPSRYGNRYAYGHTVENGRHLIVSGGIGTVTAGLAPVRLGVPPEIVVVELG